MNTGICIACNSYTEDHVGGKCPICRGEQPDTVLVPSGEVILSTEATVVDLEIQKRLGIVSSEAVLGINAFKDIFTSMTDFAGGRSGTLEGVLRTLRREADAELKNRAKEMGANMVIAVSHDYEEISGGGKKSMMFVVASGTAVRVGHKSRE